MIKLENLSKYYYGNNSVALGLRKINLEFSKGEFVAITGESGSGKTTLLSTISGMLPYEEGEMYFQGKETSHYDESDWEEYRKNHIAFVFQNYNLVDCYTALENVMTSFLIQGEKEEFAKEKSMELLRRVGIAEFADHRATELSSGQKQRLSIARALAKNTEVIVADEPTGNLDAENGQQIMELFAELSKDKLVLVVTHNFDEAAPFVTRKIVIHDAEVEEDILLAESHSEIAKDEKVEEIISEKNLSVTNNKKEQIKDLLQKEIESVKQAWTFAWMNIKSRQRKSLLLIVFLCIVSIASFLFAGNFLANLDDTSTKNYQKSGFSNISKMRIVVRHPNGDTMTDEDFAFLQELEHVEYVEEYSLANDVNYFTEKGVDYQVTYHDDRTSLADELIYREEITLDSFSKYVYSVSNLDEKDLRWGRLPETTNEVAIFAEDESMLGSTFVCYFHKKGDWTKNAYIRLEMTVSGILRERTEQYYFSDKLCKVLNNEGLVQEMTFQMEGEKNWQEVIFYIDDTLQLEAENIAAHEDVKEQYGNTDTTQKIYNEMSLSIKKYRKEEWQQVVDIDHSEVLRPIITKQHQSTKIFMALSEEQYAKLFANVENTQMGVWIEDYAYIEDALNKIQDAGYEAVAPYQVGAIEYDEDKVNERLLTLSISLAAWFVLFLLEILIVTAFMKNEKHDDLVLKSIGMQQEILTKIKAFTLLFYMTVGFLGMMILAVGIGRWIPFVNNILDYYRYYHVILLYGLSAMAMLITAACYKRYLTDMLRAGSEVRVS